MEPQQRRRILILGGILVVTCVLCIAAMIWFSPKPRVIGGLRGGPIGPGEQAYREDFACLGFPTEFCPNWPDYGCDYLCYGVVYGRECSVETFTDGGLTRQPTECQ